MPDDTRPVRIDNIDELKDMLHYCTAQETLTKIQVDQGKLGEGLVHFGVCFEELTTQLQEQNKNLQAFIEGSNDRMRLVEINMNKQHVCSKETQLIAALADITNLKLEFASMRGESKWIDRVVAILQSVLVAVVVLLATWFMRGGAIT